MKRSRYQSRLNKKLEEDNKARTDVSRKSLPKKNEQTLVPEITFSDITPNETIQEPNGRVRRSSRLSLKIGNSVLGTSSTLNGLPESTEDQTTPPDSESANEKADASKTLEGKGAADDRELGSSVVTGDDTSVKRSKCGPAASKSDSARLGQKEPTEIDAGRSVPERKLGREQRKSPRKETQRKTSKIPKARGEPAVPSVKQGDIESDMEIDDTVTNDENDPKNSLLNSLRSNQDTIEDSYRQGGRVEGEEESKDVSMRTLRRKKVVDYSLMRPYDMKARRERKIREDEVQNQEKNPSETLEDPESEAAPKVADFGLKNLKIVLERVEIPEMESGDTGSQLDRSTAHDEDEQDVSLETLEIRKRIEKKCLRDNESSDEDDLGGNGAANSEKLFDKLIEPPKRAPSLEILDSSSYYQGTIPSRLFPPEIESRPDTEPAKPADGLTERFDAFKQSNSQKTASQATSTKPTGTQEPIVPSFTLEEEATNDLDEVTNRAITLCMDEDSDADLDVVMKSKSRKSAAAGNTMVDPVFCDIGTSMGLPAAGQKDADSLVLMIDSTSRESSETRQTQAEPLMQISRIESLSGNCHANDVVSEDDQGDELKNPRKSKLQSTLLPSPKLHAEVAVGTGPSLMATVRETETFQDERVDAIVIDDEGEASERSESVSGTRDRNKELVQQDVKDIADVDRDQRAPETGSKIQAEPHPDPDILEASIAFEAPPKLLEALRGKGTSSPEDEAYDTDEIFSEEERAPKEEQARKHAVTENKRKNEEKLNEEDGLVEADREEAAEADPENMSVEEGGEGNEEERAGLTEKVASQAVDGAETNPDEASDKAPRARTSSDQGFMLEDQSLPKGNLLEGMDSVPLLEMIDDNLDELDLPGATLILSQALSEEPSSKRGKGKPRDETPRLLLHKETPRSKVPLSADYKVGRDISGTGKRETPLSLFREIRKPRLSRRTLFDEAADIPTDILPNPASANSLISTVTEKRRKTFALDSTRLPTFDDTYVEADFDARELKKRGEELFQQAARNLLDLSPEYKSNIQHAFEDLLTNLQDPIKRMMSLLVRKYALKEACEARKESYLSTQTRLARTRKYITDTATKLMPEDETNAVKIFGFNPFAFKEPPPEPVREMNKMKAIEDEERLKKRFRRSAE